jgi:hypothetical protein
MKSEDIQAPVDVGGNPDLYTAVREEGLRDV